MKIEKRGYSRKPWRLITSAGLEVWLPAGFDHPDIGVTVISEPVCGDTKAECTDKALALLEHLLRTRTTPAAAAA